MELKASQSLHTCSLSFGGQFICIFGEWDGLLSTFHTILWACVSHVHNLASIIFGFDIDHFTISGYTQMQ